jgi:hypothetical protein
MPETAEADDRSNKNKPLGSKPFRRHATSSERAAQARHGLFFGRLRQLLTLLACIGKPSLRPKSGGNVSWLRDRGRRFLCVKIYPGR